MVWEFISLHFVKLTKTDSTVIFIHSAISSGI